MIIRKYIVNDLKEGVIRAKYELGEDAMIISHKEIKTGKWYEIFKPKKLEVTVAIDEIKEEKNKEKKKKEKFTYTAADIKNANPILKDSFKDRKEQALGFAKLNLKENPTFTQKELKNFIRYIYRDNCFDKKVKETKINVFIGPTGVGKTTTIAKIAAREHLINKKHVGLITMDTYRIGAVEQLKTYATILGLPFEVAMNPKEIKSKIDKFKECDLILLDTLGTSQKNEEKLSGIKKYLSEIDEDFTTLLTVSMSTNSEILESILKEYQELNYDGIVLTKFDEIVNYKNFWNILETNKYPVQFFCFGQDVPEDIKVASLDNLISYSEEMYNGRSS